MISVSFAGKANADLISSFVSPLAPSKAMVRTVFRENGAKMRFDSFELDCTIFEYNF